MAAGLVGLGLNRADWDPTVFAGFGEESLAITEYAEDRLGDVRRRPSVGHDGRFFFVQANDPWVVDPANNGKILDRPVYRSQRMLYPLIAGGFGLFDANTIVWSLLLVNVAAMGLGTFVTSRLALQLGGSPWWGLAFVANFGLLFTLTNDDAGIVAAALALWAVAKIHDGQLQFAVALLAGAALTREVMLVCALGLAIWLWLTGRRKAAVYTLVVPTVVTGAWFLYVRAQLGPDDAATAEIGLPFVGLARAIPAWLDDSTVTAAGVAVVLVMVLFLVRWAGTRTALGWTFVGFIPLAALLTEQVWREIFDFTRAVAPLLTAAVLLVFVESKRRGVDGTPAGPAGLKRMASQ